MAVMAWFIEATHGAYTLIEPYFNKFIKLYFPLFIKTVESLHHVATYLSLSGEDVLKFMSLVAFLIFMLNFLYHKIIPAVHWVCNCQPQWRQLW